MEGVRDHERLQQALCRLKQGLATLHAGEVRVGCSAGAVLFPEGGDTFDALYKSADVALYDAKRAGKGRFTVYDGGRRAASSRRRCWSTRTTLLTPSTPKRASCCSPTRRCAPASPRCAPAKSVTTPSWPARAPPCEGCDARKLLDQAREGEAGEAEALCAEWLRARANAGCVGPTAATRCCLPASRRRARRRMANAPETRARRTAKQGAPSRSVRALFALCAGAGRQLPKKRPPPPS